MAHGNVNQFLKTPLAPTTEISRLKPRNRDAKPDGPDLRNGVKQLDAGRYAANEPDGHGDGQGDGHGDGDGLVRNDESATAEYGHDPQHAAAEYEHGWHR